MRRNQKVYIRPGAGGIQRTGGLVWIWQQPPKLQAGGSNPLLFAIFCSARAAVSAAPSCVLTTFLDDRWTCGGVGVCGTVAIAYPPQAHTGTGSGGPPEPSAIGMFFKYGGIPVPMQSNQYYVSNQAEYESSARNYPRKFTRQSMNHLRGTTRVNSPSPSDPPRVRGSRTSMATGT